MAKLLKEPQFTSQFLSGSKISLRGNSGISIIEILVAITIIIIALVSLFNLNSLSLKASTLVKQTTRANFIAQEVMEAVRNFRDGTSWSINGLGVLTPGASYHPEKSIDNPPKWQIILGEGKAGGFTRKVVFNDVFRDSNDNIVETGGTLDLETKKAAVIVSWQDGGRNHQIELVTYLTNWKQ